MKKRIIAILVLASMLICALAACGQTAATTTETPAAETPAATETPAAATPAAETPAAETPAVTPAAEPVTLTWFSNLPDRTTSQGLIEDMAIALYKEIHPEVTINVETLAEEEFKAKVRANIAAGVVSGDILTAWGQSSYLTDPAHANLFVELNEADYADYGFVSGSLDAFKVDGKLYGLPRNTDIMAIFYNKAMFDEYGWQIPATYEELLALGKTISDEGIIPMTIGAKDGWIPAIWVQDVIAKMNGSFGVQTGNAVDAGDFSDPAFVQGAQYLVDACDAGLFEKGFDTIDYNASKAQFTSGLAAMFYMGGWEMGMATATDVDVTGADVRAFAMPAPVGAKGKSTDIAAWNGGGYALGNGDNVEAAKEFLAFLMSPEVWTKLCWENGICMSAQDFSAFATGSETDVQKDFIEIFSTATSITGTTYNDRGSAAFKAEVENTIQKVMTKAITPQQYFDALAAVVASE